jgi:murein DD-endopeptidase MepM/ murein hydrolase activator NlpD
MPLTRLLIPLLLLCACIDARADIYRYTDGDGVECFTDSPVSRNAVRVMRDGTRSARPSANRRTPSHLATLTDTAPAPSASGQAERDADVSFILPVRGPVTSGVGPRIDPIDGIVRDHNGVDIAVCEGTPVRPVGAGRVVYSGPRGGYGNMVVVEHADGMVTLYAHNSVNLAPVGAVVDRDSIIARSGSTGRSTGPHLHFEAWKNDVNMTAAFLPGGSPFPSGAGSRLVRSVGGEIRRGVAPDGSLIFSNLPLAHP